jgi:cell division protein FtsL
VTSEMPPLPQRGASRPARGRAVVALLVVLAALAAAALGHVWVRLQQIQVGYALSRETREAHRLAESQKRLRIEAAVLKHPARIERIARTRLNMSPPDADKIHPVRPTRLAGAERHALARAPLPPVVTLVAAGAGTAAPRAAAEPEGAP